MSIATPAPLHARTPWSTASVMAALLLTSALSVATTLLAVRWTSAPEAHAAAGTYPLPRPAASRPSPARPDTSVPDAAAALRGRVFDLDEMAPTF